MVLAVMVVNEEAGDDSCEENIDHDAADTDGEDDAADDDDDDVS